MNLREKAKLIMATNKLKQKEFCEEFNLNPVIFHYWLKAEELEKQIDNLKMPEMTVIDKFYYKVKSVGIKEIMRRTGISEYTVRTYCSLEVYDLSKFRKILNCLDFTDEEKEQIIYRAENRKNI